jgi:hypothetical protein
MIWQMHALVGSLCADNGHVYVGSRLTIYEAEDSWRTLHLPLLMFTTICGTEAILGALRRTMTNEGQRGGDSKWTERDFTQVEGYLSRMCVCTTGGLGLTAEFGLNEGAVSAAAGDHKTALFQLMADQPHPELGGGLFCLLQMPHQLRDEHRLNQVGLQLNNMEMAAATYRRTLVPGAQASSAATRPTSASSRTRCTRPRASPSIRPSGR